MNTTELTYEIARRTKHTRTPLSRREVGQVLDLLLELMAEEITRSGGSIHLKQFGTFTAEQARMPGGALRNGTGRTRQNPTGDTYLRLRFRPSRRLRQRLRSKM